jgi:hypothetical protein
MRILNALRIGLCVLSCAGMARGNEVVRAWNEMREMDGVRRLIQGRLVVDPSGAHRTEYVDEAGHPLPAAFEAANQKPWGVVASTATEVPAARPDGRPRRRPYWFQLRTNSVTVALPAPDLAPILEEDRRNDSEARGAKRIGFFRGIVKPVLASGSQSGQWSTLPDGSRVWTLLVSSPGAEGIRIELSDMNVPPGTQFSTFDPSQPQQEAEVHNASSSSGGSSSSTFWTETTFSSTVGLEVVLPKGVDGSALRFAVRRIVHVYVKLSDLARPKEGDCHNDVSCYASWATLAAAVSGLGSIGSDGFLFCTGCLLADTDPSTTINYYMTANHCVENQAQADSLEFYWFYQTDSCIGTVPNVQTVPRTSGGADYLAGATRNGGTDFAFLRMRQDPPGGVAYAGWSTASLAANEAITGIHHPDGAYKRISFGNFFGYDGNFTDVRWSSGVTEPGSSGSPLFNAGQLFVGQLYGGESYCFRPNGIDTYGRFDVTYPIIASYLSSAAPGSLLHYEDPQDFDGDSRSDLAIYHPDGGTWYFLKSAAGFALRPFGYQPTLQGVGDFDGDNRSDLVIFDPASGMWYILTATEGFITQQFGYRNTLPVPGDYDGDGATDFGVFDVTDGNWYLIQSGAGFRIQNFGFAGVTPLPDDYDGDGRTDFCVYDAATGVWYLLQSSEGFRAQHFGFAGVVPAPADYDGDGRTDIAVFDSSGANWYVLRSSAGFTSVSFGAAGGFAVPRDYDGDGIDDIATYKLETGSWLIRKSAGGIRTNPFGWSEAPPVGLSP